MHFQRYIITGVLTIIPIWITWWVFDFFLRQLSSIGAPLVRFSARLIDPVAPGFSAHLLEPWTEFMLAVLLTLGAVYLLGILATLVIGRRLLALMDAIMRRIPVAERIYGATRQLVSVLQQQPGHDVERVVLIEFPQPGMKVIGFVTRTFTDPDSGEKLAAVYVPTTPNPTSGYLELVPLESVISTSWTVDEAMSFVISGGTVGPDSVPYSAANGDEQRPG
ncbi:MAG: DUF502 domain-containing protein [Pseudomonadota bacterium]